MIINQFNPASLKPLETELLAAMKAIAEKYGVTVKFDGGRFLDQEANLKFKLTCQSASGESAEATFFKRHCIHFGLAPEDLGRKFTVRGTRYELTGMRNGHSKFKFYGKDANGKTLVFTADITKLLEPKAA